MHSELINRKELGNLRQLKQNPDGIDFYSNDYLGLCKNQQFKGKLHDLIRENPDAIMGSTGSRLISGNSKIKMEVEEAVAGIHKVQKALFFPNGYAANLALFSCILKKGDVIILDEKIHRSIYDGCRLSFATRWKFKHNELDHLAELLKKASSRTTGNIFIAVESLYSMDGDIAPIQEISELAGFYGAKLIIDEAHSLGVSGIDFIQTLGLKYPVFARVLSYGKAMGLYGASILGSSTLIDYLVNFSSPFIYSTSMSDFSYLAVKESYSFLQEQPQLISKLQQVIQSFKVTYKGNNGTSPGPIQPLYFANLFELKQTVKRLSTHGINCYGVSYPAVDIRYPCIRITLHSFNTLKEIQLLTTLL